MPRAKTPCEEVYASYWWKKLREVVLTTDPVCVYCGGRVAEHAHHIDGDCTNNDLSNLEGLCRPCHQEVTWRNRENYGHG